MAITSANLSGEPPATSIEDIEEMGGEVPLTN